jgi:hypothetical protein
MQLHDYIRITYHVTGIIVFLLTIACAIKYLKS